MKYLKLQKIEIVEYLIYIIFIFSTLSTYLLSELYFYVPNGVDWITHSKYLSYFHYASESTHTSYGLIYYFIVALLLFLRKGEVSNLNAVNYINSNIQTANFLLYLIGILGFYFLLKSYNYTKRSILISLTLLNFLIPIFIMRSILKPEIFAFCLLPWIILGLDKYFKSISIKNFLFVVAPLSIALTIKGSITGMLILFFLIKYFKYLKNNFKTHFFCFIILILSFSLISYESNKINNYSILEHNLSQESDKYNNRAPLSFIYNLHKWDFYYNPEYPYHNDSLIGITLLDTFGDYFNVFIDYDEHLFIYNKEVNFTANFFDKNGFVYGQYLTNYASILFTLLFYGLGLFFSFKEKNFLAFYLAPLIGIFILILNIFGFPFNHFDPNKGDTMKSNYYSFLIGVAFIFIFVKIFSKINLINIVLFLILVSTFFLSLGFPKTENSQMDSYLEQKIYLSPICEVASLFIGNVDFNNCHNKVNKICKYNIYSNDAQNILSPEKTNLQINEDNPVLFLDKDNKKIKANSYEECSELIKKGNKLYNPTFNKLRLLPPINLIYLLITVGYIFNTLLGYLNRNYLNNKKY